MGEHKLLRNKSEKIMPAFVFLRQHDIEVEGGFILAGRLVLVKDVQEQAPAIVQQLLDELKSGRLPTDAVTTGWRGGGRPPNAVDMTPTTTRSWRPGEQRIV